jgi:putative transposase
MVNYRRNYVAGGCYFFTVILRNRKATTLTDNIHLLRQAFRKELTKRPFVINSIVALPEHLHILWTLPENDSDYSGRWQAIKGSFFIYKSVMQKG